MTLAVKIFAALNDFDDEDQAKNVMYKHGFAEDAEAMAEKLEPLFVDAALIASADALTMFRDSMPDLVVDSAEKQGFQAAIEKIREALTYAVGLYNDLLDTGLPIKDEAEPELEFKEYTLEEAIDLFREVFNVSPTR